MSIGMNVTKPMTYISTGAFPTRNLSEIFNMARDWGISNIELSSDVAHDPENLSLMRLNRNKFEFLLHNYFPAPAEPFVLNLAAADDDMLKRSRAHCIQALEISAEVGAPIYGAHAGFLLQPRPDQLGKAWSGPTIPRQTAYDIFLDSVNLLIDEAKKLGVTFLIENNVVAPSNVDKQGQSPLLLADPQEIKKFAKDIGEDFGILMDVGHLNVSAASLGFNVLEALHQIDPHIVAYHLSDNNGLADSNEPITNESWFVSCLIDSKITTIEVYNADANIIENCLSVLGSHA
jgi:sugar phosphate isomerase/epimerase